jgi:ribosomal protein L2
MKNLQQVIAKSNEAKLALSKVGVVLGDNILVKTFGCSMELITCTDDTLATRIFGGSVDVMGHQDWNTNKREIKLNCGSMGGFDNTCIASVSKVTMQANILANWSGFATVVTLLMDKEETANQLAALLQD